MQSMKLKLTGLVPLLMHNARLADPLDEHAKALKKVSSIRKKTDEHHEQMAEIEFLGGLYHSESTGYYLPGEMIEACLVNGAKAKKLGTTFRKAMQIIGEELPLLGHGGDSDPHKLCQNPNFRLRKSVVVGQVRVMRTRPIFKNWAVEVELVFDEELLDREDILDAAKYAGQFVSVGTWRPRYGKFTVEEIKS